MPMLVVSIMSQLVFSGGMISGNRPGVPISCRLVHPGRWGFAAAASTIDLTGADTVVRRPQDGQHLAVLGEHILLFDMGDAGGAVVVYAGIIVRMVESGC